MRQPNLAEHGMMKQGFVNGPWIEADFYCTVCKPCLGGSERQSETLCQWNISGLDQT